jgi:hypothetical protein
MRLNREAPLLLMDELPHHILAKAHARHHPYGGEESLRAQTVHGANANGKELSDLGAGQQLRRHGCNSRQMDYEGPRALAGAP